MKLYRRIKALLVIVFIWATVGIALSVVNSISRGAPIDFLTYALVYGVLGYGFVSLRREKKALDEEMK